jgi:ADP-ribosyl-[dinitrogen reductase] hydrolase
MSELIGTRERVVGALVGLAAGDALGVPVEFEPRAARTGDPVRDMRGGGTWKLEPGTWSDDTSLALCLAESIVEKGFDPEDSGRRSLAWLDEGLWTARGTVFDVGGATRRALGRIRSGLPAVFAGGRGENDNGNGSLMRILPA